MNEYNTEEQKPKFQITRGMVILSAIILIILIIVVITITRSSKNKADKFTTQDFVRLENRMIEEAPTYLSQKGIELTDQDIRIDLKELLVENGGAIDSNKLKVTKICEGYVLAKKLETRTYKAYISCDGYKTKGYQNDNQTTTKKKTQKDNVKPVITIIGEKEITVVIGSSYKEEGAKAQDNVDGDLTSNIKIDGMVDVNKEGTYTITYTVSDKAGNKAKEKRVVMVSEGHTTLNTTTTKKKNVNTTKKSVKTTKTSRKTMTQKIDPPTIILKGDPYVTINIGQLWVDPGYSAYDAKGMDITASVNRSGNVNNNVAGTYRLTYSVSDSYGNNSYKTRTIVVKSNYVKLRSLSITPNSFTLKVGTTKKLTINFSPTNATNKNVTWKSSNPSVASVSNGVVRALKKGVATISVTGADNVSTKASVTVK